ncbi:MAG: SDR family NAD(P)-dependent oxidoreductase [Gammaproteobacteria bacterium]|nr:SDR family NAD(P)-dependent oxidoreductase [Gammaproteobacteria bacterium]
MNTAIVMGVGPLAGMGAQLALRFASFDLEVLVAGRDSAKLAAVVDAVARAGGKARAVVADATREADVVALFAKAAAIGRIDCAIYNAGNNTPGRIADMSADYFENAWRICCYGGFLFGREALRHMQGHGQGTVLFTGASASLRGRANFGAFAAGKAGLRSFAQALAKEAGPLGIHVGHVVIDGAINGDKIRARMPDYAAKLGDDGMISISALVDAYAFLYRQPRHGWSFEFDVRTAQESW